MSTRRPRFVAPLAFASALLVANCGPGPKRSPVAATDEYFPMVPGARWSYELRSSMGDLRVEMLAKGAVPVHDRELRVFVIEETIRDPSLGFVETSPVAYLVESGYVARLSAVDYDREGRLRVLGQDAPTWLLPLDPRPGARWRQEHRLFATPEGGGARMGWEGEVRGLTTLTVPAGTFRGALEVRTTYYDRSRPDAASAMVYTDFYVRGVGLARSLSVDPEGDEARTVELRLLDYRFPEAQAR